MPARAAACLALCAAVLLAAPASAHDVGLSRGAYVVHGARVTAEVTMSDRELGALDVDLDLDDDGKVTQADLDKSHPLLDKAVVARIDIRGDGKPCNGSIVGARRLPSDAVRFDAQYACEAAPARVELRFPLMEDLWPNHNHVATITAGETVVKGVLDDPHKTLAIDLPAAGEPPKPQTVAAPAPSFLAMLRMGVEHILFGYDHLVFLLGVVLVGGRWRDLLWVITAFTVAHSVTLALAALGIWAPSSHIIEPAIALSIAYVGVENFFVPDVSKRWRITAPFGLVHGFGFAGALAEIELPRNQIPLALVAFNVGVEAGQLAVMALIVPLVLYARKREMFREKGVKALNVAIVLAGLTWFVLRITGL